MVSIIVFYNVEIIRLKLWEGEGEVVWSCYSGIEFEWLELEECLVESGSEICDCW